MNRAERRRLVKMNRKRTGYRTPQEIIDDEIAKLQVYYQMLDKQVKRTENND